MWKNLSVPGVNDALQRHHCTEDNVVEHQDKPWLMILSHSQRLFPQLFGGDGLQNRMQVKNTTGFNGMLCSSLEKILELKQPKTNQELHCALMSAARNSKATALRITSSKLGVAQSQRQPSLVGCNYVWHD